MLRILLTILCLFAAAAPALAKPSVTAARIGVHADKTRFVMELSESPAYRVFTLPDPYRVVIDLPEIDWRLGGDRKPASAGLIGDLRFGLFSPGTSRVVLDVKAPIKVRAVRVLPPSGGSGNHRLLVDLVEVGRAAFLKDERRPIVSKRPLPKPRTPGAGTAQGGKVSGDRRVVVIDAGHGGVDPGATGVSGIQEKVLVLQYARELKRQLEATGRYRVVLTRTRDIFLPLRSRIEIAQRAEGDLFISLHANSHSRSSIRGASVYTLSERASDAEAAALATKENEVDVLAGLNLGVQSQDVSMILLDLAQRETMNLSKNFANTMVSEMGKATRLLKNTHRFAGFVVLKSPTVPSVLVEIGYMSNRKEEAQLRSKGHRVKVVSSIRHAIDRYFKWQEQMSRS